MTVKDLIENLQRFDPDQRVLFRCVIDSFRTRNYCFNGKYSLKVKGKTKTSKGRVIFDISGELADFD